MTERQPDAGVFQRLESPGTKTFSLSEAPPVFRSGKGVRLTATDGRVYLDFACGSGTSSVGHGNSAVLAAVRAQLASGVTHLGPHFHSESQAAFFEQIRDVLPRGPYRLHPATSGAEATEVALKACMHFTGSRTFLAFAGGYHGRTLGALAVSHAKGANAGLGPWAPAAEFVPYPRGPDDAEAEAAAVRAIAGRAGSAAPLAGVILEPVQATAGIVVPPATFLGRVAEAARAAAVPLILDEVFTGFGRTGRTFAFEAADLAPDVIVMGKSLGGGFPGALVAGRADVMSAWPRGAQSSTFQLHPVTAAAAGAALRYLQDHDLCARARDIGAWIETHRPALEASSLVAGVRGLGAMYGIEIGVRAGAAARALCGAVRLAALKHGLLTWECGLDGNVVGLIPPLVAAKSDVDEACDILARSLAEVEAGVPPE